MTIAAHLPVGHMIGDMRIDDVLGQGGFGVTYLATDVARQSQAAVKEHFPSQLAVRDATGNLCARRPEDLPQLIKTRDDFNAEARLLLRFSHEALPRFRRLIEQHGTGYLVMDFEKGVTLKGWASETPAREIEPRLLTLLEPIGDALSYLHRNGVFHRDVKPDNIIVRTDGTPVLIDFGIAHDAARASHLPAGLPEMHLVSPGFSPIEQYGHGAISAATDVHALAATCYDLVAKHPLIDAQTRFKALQAGAPDPLPPVTAAARAPLSDAFAAAIMAGLAVDPRARVPTVQDWMSRLPSHDGMRAPARTRKTITMPWPTRWFSGLSKAAEAEPRNDRAARASVAAAQGPARQTAKRAPRSRPALTAGQRDRLVTMALVALLIVGLVGFLVMFVGSFIVR